MNAATDREASAYDALSRHARLADLAEIAHSLMTSAVQTRRATRQPEWVASLAAERHVVHEDAATSFGNALEVLEHGPENPAGRALACALAAHAVAHHPPVGKADEERAAQDLVWLAAHTAFDATGLLDRALGDAAAPLWTAIAARLRRIDRGDEPSVGRAEAFVAALALAGSEAPGADARARALAAEVGDRRLTRVLSGCAGDRGSLGTVTGELASAPRGRLTTAALGLTGLLLAARTLQILGKALSYRRPVDITLTAEGDLRVRWRVQLLGSTLREGDALVPRAALANASREARVAGLSFYAGLLALALGTYVGLGTFSDGVRAASPPLLGAGLAIAAAGLLLDFVLSCVAPAARGRCLMLFVRRDGVRLSVAGVEAARADALLDRLAASLRRPSHFGDARSPSTPST